MSHTLPPGPLLAVSSSPGLLPPSVLEIRVPCAKLRGISDSLGKLGRAIELELFSQMEKAMLRFHRAGDCLVTVESKSLSILVIS